jgi:ornithine carbamoyltransferase
MSKRDFCNVLDFTTEEIHTVFQMAIEMKREVPGKRFVPRLKDKVLAMIFEKPSLRTRCTFEIAMVQMGGSAIYLGPSEIGLGKRESVYDVAKNIERWFDLVMVRTFAQDNVEGLAQHCRVPVINALSDRSHPCQAMADFMTILEKRGSFKGFKMAYVGDGNNICNSLIELSARLGTDIRVVGPASYWPREEILADARAVAQQTGGKIFVTENVAEALDGVDAIYTDVWTSMGQEAESVVRRQVFAPYQVNAKMLEQAPKTAWIMHDLPAHRGEEITDEVMDCPRAILFDQAENRLHAQKAVMVFLDERSRG